MREEDLGLAAVMGDATKLRLSQQQFCGFHLLHVHVNRALSGRRDTDIVQERYDFRFLQRIVKLSRVVARCSRVATLLYTSSRLNHVHDPDPHLEDPS